MIRLVDIHKSYGSATGDARGRVEVLCGVSLEIFPSRVAAILGPSGAGKSTLLNILGTLEQADSGRIIYDGVDVTTFKDKELSRFRNRHIGFVFQSHRLLPEFTIVENVAMPAMIGGEPQSRAMEHARELLERLGLSHRLSHRPAQLSGGECQRALTVPTVRSYRRCLLICETPWVLRLLLLPTTALLPNKPTG